MSLLPEQCTGVASRGTAGLCQRGYPGFSEKTERDSGRSMYFGRRAHIGCRPGRIFETNQRSGISDQTGHQWYQTGGGKASGRIKAH